MSKQQKGMEKALEVGMKILLASMCDAALVAAEYEKQKRVLAAPQSHEQPGDGPQS